MQRGNAWRHPWNALPTWNAKRKVWYAQLVAGFVNGVAPMVRTTAGDLRYARASWFGQLIDARSGAAEIDQAARLAASEFDDLPDNTRVDVPLYNNPPVVLNSWKAIGWDGGGVVPAYFRDWGVNQAPPGVQAQLEGGGQIALDSLTPPKGNRLLRSCDVFLRQPRSALTSDISIEGTLVVQMLGTRAPVEGEKLRILTGSYDEWKEEQNRAHPEADVNAIANNYEEAQADHALIATVYLLSGPDAEPGSDPDGSWEPFVKHTLFWNLHWKQPVLSTLLTNMPITAAIASVTLLGSGAASIAINAIANAIDTATNAAINLLRGTSLAGTFWTPTGGGTTSVDPFLIQEATWIRTLDKAKNTEAKARARQAQMRARRLDPPFPFEGRSFTISPFS